LKSWRDEFLKVQTASVNIENLLTAQARKMMVVGQTRNFIQHDPSGHLNAGQLFFLN